MGSRASVRSDLATATRAALAAACAATLVTLLAGVALSLTASLARPGGQALDDAVAVAAVALGACAFAVIGLGCLLTAVGAVARLGGRSLGRVEAAGARLVPAALRRTIAVGVGAGLLAGLAGPATATEPDAQGPGVGSDGVAAVTVVDLGWRVTSPAAVPPGDADGTPASVPTPAPVAELVSAPVPAPATTPEVPAGPSGPSATVTVRAGDSLWSIAAAHLPPGSHDAAVASAWPQWYAANADVVGADPDLIHPGQVLVVPGQVQS